MVDGRTIATSREPWLRLDVAVEPLAGRWIELVYEASFVDPVARPLLRCLAPSGEKTEILPAPIFGRAIWLGRIPAQTRAILISPTDRPGPFALRVVGLRGIALGERLKRGRRLPQTLLGVGLALAGHDFLAERHFRRALMSTPLEAYAPWREARRRAAEWDGFDALPAAAAGGPHLRVVLVDPGERTVARALERLSAQPWPRWSLAVCGAAARKDVVAMPRGATLTECLAGLAASDFVAVTDAGAEWSPETAPAVGAAALREEADLYYADEEAPLGAAPPRLKPGWSPILAESVDLIGRAWFARVGWARAALGARPVDELAASPIRAGGGDRVVHIARALLACASRPRVKRPVAAPAIAAARPAATIVIPTRDRADLLRRCLESLARVAVTADYEAIVVDNGSREPAARAYLADLPRDPRFRALDRPGPFNFSALCNDAAALARAPTLVFLNNDVEAVSAGWLDRLIAWTALPTVGAVGAKLLYPNRRLQHAGVVVGIDGLACHFERRGPAEALGYFQRRDVAHEASAVTGACLAVERAKFEAVGGFDAANLPVEFSDIDLCLRLGERGWIALVEPAAVLLHREAATRKASATQELRYAGEVAYFRARWRGRLRADPYFHPALSLDWHNAALG